MTTALVLLGVGALLVFGVVYSAKRWGANAQKAKANAKSIEQAIELMEAGASAEEIAANTDDVHIVKWMRDRGLVR